MEIIRCIYNVSFSLYMFSFGLFIIDMWKSFIFISLTRVTYCLLRACNNKWFVYNFPLFSTYSILIYLYLKAYCIFFFIKIKALFGFLCNRQLEQMKPNDTTQSQRDTSIGAKVNTIY